MPQTIKVKVELTIPVEIPTKEEDPNYDPVFDIEENHCPNTGIVGDTLDKIIKEFNEKHLCWACAFEGKNSIQK